MENTHSRQPWYRNIETAQAIMLSAVVTPSILLVAERVNGNETPP